MKIPCATYRLQFNPAFTFEQAAEIIDYLYELGISDLYASPIFKARKGSSHGYDVTDPGQINPELGGQEAFERLSDRLRSLDMGWLQDIVPNHMAYDPGNRMLMDVMEKGNRSSYFDFFDISWHVAHEEVKGKLLAPFLGKPYRQALKSGEIKLEGKSVIYHEWRFPLRIGSLEKTGKSPEEINSDPEALDRLLRDQLYKLAYWRSASEESNYRRFFNISGLISLKPQAFEKTHELIFKMVNEGKFTGLRVDHVDGLYDPGEYLSWLRERAGSVYVVVEKILSGEESLPGEWPVEGTTGYDYLNRLNGVFCELGNEDDLNKVYADFTGINFSCADLRYEKKKLVIERHMAAKVDYLARLFKRFVDLKGVAGGLSLDGIRSVLIEIIASFPVYRTYVSEKQFSKLDLHYLKQAIEEAKRRRGDLFEQIIAFERSIQIFFSEALSRPARRRLLYFLMRLQQYTGPAMAKGFEDTVLYNYNRLLSLNEVGGSPERIGVPPGEFHDFNKRMAEEWPYTMLATSTHDTKRGEDARARLNVLSELPDEWEKQLREWSRIASGMRYEGWGMRVPDANEEYFLFQALLAAFPFSMEEYPAFVFRIKEYVVKALREAKAHSSWLKPDRAYEKAMLGFIDKLLGQPMENKFLARFLPFQKKVAYFGVLNSLAQTVIKMGSPGVPDLYQGTELWDLSLVDPDNRRPVDFTRRRRYLQEIRDKDGLELFSTREDGRLKLFILWKALQARKAAPELYSGGQYLPLAVTGRHRDRVIAFARRKGDAWAVVMVPRFLTGLIKEGELPLGQGVWQDTAVVMPESCPDSLNDIFTGNMVRSGGQVRLADALTRFPVALLT